MPEDLMRRRNGALQKRMVHDQEVGVIEGNHLFHLLYRTLLTFSIQKASNHS